jgi:peptidoglycan/LPS O-acetylase OafA/YrhL
MNTKCLLYYSAAGTTAIAGILHLILAPNMLNFNLNSAILFFVGGAAQLFWAVPMLRRWGRLWYGIGIGGTLILIAIWIITRIPENPITGRGGIVNEMGIAVQAMQWAFVGLTAAILVIESRRKRIDTRTASDAA